MWYNIDRKEENLLRKNRTIEFEKKRKIWYNKNEKRKEFIRKFQEKIKKEI